MASETHIIYSRAEKATSVAIPKFRVVTGTSTRVKVTTAATEVPYGISMGATTGSSLAIVQVAMIGVAPVEASSTQTVTKGMRIAGGARSGKAQAAAAQHPVVGIALSTAAAGEVFPILILGANSRTTI